MTLGRAVGDSDLRDLKGRLELLGKELEIEKLKSFELEQVRGALRSCEDEVRVYKETEGLMRKNTEGLIDEVCKLRVEGKVLGVQLEQQRSLNEKLNGLALGMPKSESLGGDQKMRDFFAKKDLELLQNESWNQQETKPQPGFSENYLKGPAYDRQSPTAKDFEFSQKNLPYQNNYLAKDSGPKPNNNYNSSAMSRLMSESTKRGTEKNPYSISNQIPHNQIPTHLPTPKAAPSPSNYHFQPKTNLSTGTLMPAGGKPNLTQIEEKKICTPKRDRNINSFPAYDHLENNKDVIKEMDCQLTLQQGRLRDLESQLCKMPSCPKKLRDRETKEEVERELESCHGTIQHLKRNLKGLNVL